MKISVYLSTTESDQRNFHAPRDKADQQKHGTGPLVDVDKLAHGNVQIVAQ